MFRHTLQHIMFVIVCIVLCYCTSFTLTFFFLVIHTPKGRATNLLFLESNTRLYTQMHFVEANNITKPMPYMPLISQLIADSTLYTIRKYIFYKCVLIGKK